MKIRSMLLFYYMHMDLNLYLQLLWFQFYLCCFVATVFVFFSFWFLHTLCLVLSWFCCGVETILQTSFLRPTLCISITNDENIFMFQLTVCNQITICWFWMNELKREWGQENKTSFAFPSPYFISINRT